MKKFNLSVSALSFLVLLSAACKKTDNPVDPPVVIPPVVVPPVGLSQYMKLEDMASLSGFTVLKDSTWADGSSHTLLLEPALFNGLLILPSFQQKIYHGAIVKINSIGKNIAPELVEQYELNPVSVSSSNYYPGVKNPVIANPSYLGTTTFLQNLLANYSGANQSQSFTFNSFPFTHLNELNIFFGGNVDIAALFHVKTKPAATVAKVRNGLVWKVSQINFSVDMSLHTSSIFKDPANDKLLQNENLSYISSIEYGRMGLLAVQADTTRETLNVIVNRIKTSDPLTEAQLKIVANAEIHTYLNGYSASGIEAVQNAAGLQKIKGFMDLIQNPGTFSVSNYGSPLYYYMRNIVDYGRTLQDGYKVRIDVQREKINSTK
ncbi:thiol-activated cytolysin family protein [Pedobacter cryoconitis]|uniref:Thiol-activated cytolysin n=1 Tax=Pedobacter cryoconitis TaxID=188932 RepID=A0A327T171_9SPHI|nr:thiol-activated cytolysin family protein [Pedobacter cryoconitis]RAJ35416.1 thiol-activated cytolysin [Pedobacter cryoconitis]